MIETKRPYELILKLLKERRIVRHKDIISELEKQGVGRATTNRHLTKLKDGKEIEKIGYQAATQYGIKGKDKKAVYYILSSESHYAKYYDKVIKSLKSDDPSKRRYALIEIEEFRDIHLLPQQLLELSMALTKEDLDVSCKIIRIIRNHKPAVLPSDLKRFQENLIDCLKNHSRENPFKEDLVKKLTENIFYFLGVLGNPNVIEFMKEDIEKAELTKEDKATFLNLKNLYSEWYLSRIINKNMPELFDFAETLPDIKKELVFEIRKKARDNPKSYPGYFDKIDEKLAELGYKYDDSTT